MATLITPNLPKGQLFIDGVWRDSGDGRTSATFNPATETEIMKVAKATEQDVNDAVEAAHKAFEDSQWSKMGPHERASILSKIADLIEANAVRIPANVTGHSGDRDRFAHGHHAGVSFVL